MPRPTPGQTVLAIEDQDAPYIDFGTIGTIGTIGHPCSTCALR